MCGIDSRFLFFARLRLLFGHGQIPISSYIFKYLDQNVYKCHDMLTRNIRFQNVVCCFLFENEHHISKRIKNNIISRRSSIIVLAAVFISWTSTGSLIMSLDRRSSSS